MNPNVSFDRVPDPFVLPFLLFEWDKKLKKNKNMKPLVTCDRWFIFLKIKNSSTDISMKLRYKRKHNYMET